jgi:hypothetical protein
VVAAEPSQETKAQPKKRARNGTELRAAIWSGCGHSETRALDRCEEKSPQRTGRGGDEKLEL